MPAPRAWMRSPNSRRHADALGLVDFKFHHLRRTHARPVEELCEAQGAHALRSTGSKWRDEMRGLLIGLAALTLVIHPRSEGRGTPCRRRARFNASGTGGRCSPSPQRTNFPTYGFATFLMSALWVGAKAAITTETIELFLAGLPCVIARTCWGPRLFLAELTK